MNRRLIILLSIPFFFCTFLIAQESHSLWGSKPVFSEKNKKMAFCSTFSFFTGFQSFQHLNYAFPHNTHKDDYFLPGASEPGSAGTVDFNSLTYVVIGLGVELHARMGKAGTLSLQFRPGYLSGMRRDRQQNENDGRDPSHASFIFTEANRGLSLSTTLIYSYDWLRLGVEGQDAWLHIKSGWDRYSKDQTEYRTNRKIRSIGPKAGYGYVINRYGYFEAEFCILGKVLFSDDKKYSFGIDLLFMFSMN